MTFNINAFQQNGLLQGGARPALFQVSLVSGITNSIPLDANATQRFSFLCQAANLPAFNLGVIEVPYFGRKIKVAGDRDFEDWTITVMNDEDFQVREMFEKWSNDINRLESNVRSPGLDAENYFADFSVVQYGKDGNPIRSYKMNNAFPRTVSAIDLNWETTNAIEVFNVTLAYSWFVPDESAAPDTQIPYQTDAQQPIGT